MPRQRLLIQKLTEECMLCQWRVVNSPFKSKDKKGFVIFEDEYGLKEHD